MQTTMQIFHNMVELHGDQARGPTPASGAADRLSGGRRAWTTPGGQDNLRGHSRTPGPRGRFISTWSCRPTAPNLSDAELYLSAHEDQLVILDEIQRAPGLFQFCAA